MRSGNGSKGPPAAAGAKTAAHASAAGREAALAFNLANASFREGDWAAALAHSERALAADPALTVAAVLRARCLTSLGRLDEAQDAYEASLRTDNANFSAWLELGNVHRRLRALDQALQCYARAVAARPQDVRGHRASARALEELKTPEGVQRAAVYYHRAVTLAEDDPKSLAEVHHSIGRSRLDIGDAPRALEALRQAVSAAQGAPGTMSEDEIAEIATDLADALLRLGLDEDAHRLMEQASRAVDEAALVRLAKVAYRFNLWEEAIAILRRNLQLRPKSAAAHMNLADMLAKSWKLEEALAGLECAERIGPVPETASASLRAYVASRMGDADAAVRLYQKALDAGASGLRSSIAMTSLYSDHMSARERSDLHRRLFSPLGEGARSRSSFANSRRSDRPLKIGLVTGDLHHQHPVNLFLQPMLAHWDREHYPLTVYFTGGSHDEQTRLAKSRVDAWREGPDARLPLQVESDRIDVLIDLAGHTAGRLMPLFAQRMAPVQATFLGYPGSTGVPNIDWIVGDDVVTPPKHEHLYSERIIRLPHTVFCYAPEADYPYPRYDDAQAERPLTFGSFNNVPKLTPRTVRLWSEVLRAVPGSRLLLKAPSFRDSAAVARFRSLFLEHGIGEIRLVFRGPVALQDMMQEYADVDVGLDPVPYNGGTTTLQALWMGVPVVVLEGEDFASRMGASFMRAAGLPDWVASDDADYVARAAAMVSDRRALLELKRGLRHSLLTKRAWDVQAYTRAFENLLRRLW